jgi:hypothetical protein
MTYKLPEPVLVYVKVPLFETIQMQAAYAAGRKEALEDAAKKFEEYGWHSTASVVKEMK